MTLSGRVPIPEHVKRVVRQDAGFGCCKCGNPIVQYHHIVPRSEDPAEIMTLCPNCHHEATTGAMTKAEQYQHKSHPFNIQQEFVEGKLKVNHELPVITIGSNQFIGDGDFILVDQESLLSLRVNSGRLEISAQLYDNEDIRLASIENNEWRLS